MAEHPHESPEKENKQRDLRPSLKNEALAHLQNVVPEDTDSYRHAAQAVSVFLHHTADASQLLDEELVADEQRAADNPHKLPEETRVKYEQFVTQTDSLLIILPQQLQQARMVQYQPDVQARLDAVFHMIADRQELVTWIAQTRSALLQAGKLDGRPVQPDLLPKLIPIADQAWRLREKLTIPVHLDDLKTQLEKRAEPGYEEATAKVGAELEAARTLSEAKRREAGAERITQGMPSAEFILDTPETSIAVWRRLLVDGGPREKVRAAKQLNAGVARFGDDFIGQAAYREFLEEAKSKMDGYKNSNERVRILLSWAKYIGLNGVPDRVTTPDEDFDRVFAQVTGAMKAKFDEIGSLPEAKSVESLQLLLGKVERGEAVPHQTLDAALAQYTQLQKKSGQLIAGLQRWQVAENVGVVGNDAEDRTSVLGQMTRVGDKRFFAYLREQMPYGAFRPRSFYDATSNRLVLVTPGDAGTDMEEVGEFLKEGAKLTGIFAATPLLTRVGVGISSYLPFIRKIPGKKVAIPVMVATIVGIGTNETLKQAGRSGSMDQAIGLVTTTAERIQKMDRNAEKGKLQAEANVLFMNVLQLLHLARPDTDPTQPDPVLSVEAHIYTNQLLTSLGFPPAHEMGVESLPSGSLENLSPEMRDYVESKRKSKEGIGADTHAKLNGLRASLPQKEVPETPHDALLANRYPKTYERMDGTDVQALDNMYNDLKATANDPEFRKPGGLMEQTMGSLRQRLNAGSDMEAACRVAGPLWLDWTRLDTMAAKDFKRGRYQYGMSDHLDAHKQFTAGGNTYTRDSVENHQRALLQTVTPLEMLAVGRYLQDNQPTNDELITYFTQQERPSFDLFGSVDKTIERHFGRPGHRSFLGERLMRQWTDMYGYIKYLDRKR